MTDDIQTAPCPFCGADGPTMQLDPQMFCRMTDIPPQYAVSCDDPDDCGAQGPFRRRTMQGAIDAWNNRKEAH